MRGQTDREVIKGTRLLPCVRYNWRSRYPSRTPALGRQLVDIVWTDATLRSELGEIYGLELFPCGLLSRVTGGVAGELAACPATVPGFMISLPVGAAADVDRRRSKPQRAQG